jgi:hypothetical protein
MCLRNLIFQSEVVEQRFRTIVLPHHDEHAYENGDPVKHGEESSPSSTTLWPPFSLLIAVTFSTPTPDSVNHRAATSP